MSLINCHECKKEVSTEAKTCPNCGAKVEKPTSFSTKVIASLFGIAILSAILSEPSGSTPPPKKVESPEETITRLEKEARYSKARSFQAALKEQMRDPESLQIDSLRISDDASILCSEYRAKNGFGGMNREIVVMHRKKDAEKNTVSQNANDWNKHCKQKLYDMKWALR